MVTSTFSRVALAAALVMSASTASAIPSKCQSALEKIVNKYGATVQKSVSKCIDGVAKLQDGGDPVEAEGCDKAIIKLESARAKTLGKCLGVKCDDADLLQLGHLVSGINAPAGAPFGEDAVANGASFVCSYLIKRAEHLALQTTLAANGAAPSLLKAAADADTLTPTDGIGPFFYGSASGHPAIMGGNWA
ncbi:MAG TPA: hypothetical protein VEB21_12655, partial [Terriglobales bacterium]|nr:hypothetical protein [Terriglobales bacterium]